MKRKIILILSTAIFVLFALFILKTHFVYEASATAQVSPDALQAKDAVFLSFVKKASSRSVIEKAVKQLGLEGEGEILKLQKNLTVTGDENTGMVRLAFKSRNSAFSAAA